MSATMAALMPGLETSATGWVEAWAAAFSFAQPTTTATRTAIASRTAARLPRFILAGILHEHPCSAADSA